jgi:hypothetical protein
MRAMRGATVLLVLLVLLTLAFLVAGCGVGDDGTTTTLAPVPPGSTTSSSVPTSESTPVTSGPTETTAVPTTTATTGIVISIPTTSESTTTTEVLSSAEKRLSNGHIKAMGFIDKVYIKDGKRYLSIDYAEMLGGQAAIDAAIKAGYIQPGEDLPNDYWISNENPQKRVFEISDSVAITTSTRWVDPGEDQMGAPCTWTDFKSFWGPASALGESETQLHASPWWIERDGQVVVKIDEQYLP